MSRAEDVELAILFHDAPAAELPNGAYGFYYLEGVVPRFRVPARHGTVVRVRGALWCFYAGVGWGPVRCHHDLPFQAFRRPGAT